MVSPPAVCVMRVMAVWCDFQQLDLGKILDIIPVLSKIDFGRASQFTSFKPVLSLKPFLLNRSRYCIDFFRGSFCFSR